MKKTQAVEMLRQHYANRLDITAEDYHEALHAVLATSKLPSDLKRPVFKTVCRLREQAERGRDRDKLQWAELALERIGG